MYISVRDRPVRSRGAARATSARLAPTVLLLGTVSLLTDVSSESVNAVLPIYLTSVLGLGALAYGFIDGIYQGATALVRILAGWLADRSDRPKWVAVVGYGVSALSRAALLPAHGFAAITSVITLDRLGKGVRTAPRDALIASSTPAHSLGRAFGVHRAMDTAGALIGPLLAFWILLMLPSNYHGVFIVSFAFAIVGFAVLVLFVPDLRTRAARQDDQQPAAIEPASAPSLRLLLDPRLLRLCAGATLLGLLTVGDGFLYLQLTERDSLATKYFPLLYAGSNISYLVLAVPLGRLADRIGRVPVFLGGHLALLGSYLAAGGVLPGAWATLTCLALLGSYYAATDGVLAAIAGQLVPALRASAIATAQTVVSLARFAASIGFGLAWTLLGRSDALHLFTGLLMLAIPVAVWVLPRTRRQVVPAGSAQ
ncbi:MAG: MFS transporter [Jatrophihabitantaceae bacterium]